MVEKRKQAKKKTKQKQKQKEAKFISLGYYVYLLSGFRASIFNFQLRGGGAVLAGALSALDWVSGWELGTLI